MTTSMQDQATLRDALDDLAEALDAHLSACLRSTGEADPGVQSAYMTVRDTAARYDDLLFTMLEEVTPWEFHEGTHFDPGEESEQGVVSILVRRDYAVADGDALQAAGREVSDEPAPDDAGDDRGSAGALDPLLLAYGADGLDERAESLGLRPLGGTIWVQRLAARDTVRATADDPFAVADERLLLCRIDEVTDSEREP